jgi:hypothetical protein
MKQLLKAGLILASATVLSLTMANAKCGGETKDAPKTMKCAAGKCQNGKCDSGKKAMKEKAEKEKEKKEAAMKCGKGKCGDGK